MQDDDDWSWSDGKTEVFAEVARGEPVVRMTSDHAGRDVFCTPDEARALARLLLAAADEAARLSP